MRNFEESPKFEESSRKEEADVLEFRPPGKNMLLGDDQLVSMRQRWGEIQSRFVDSPREAVQEADKLVTSCIDEIAKGFKDQRSHLQKEWETKNDVSTEDLRVALQHYRSFFDRLLST